MSRGVVVIIGFTSSQTSATLKTYTNFHKIPFINLKSPVINYEETSNDEKREEIDEIFRFTQNSNTDLQDIEEGNSDIQSTTPKALKQSKNEVKRNEADRQLEDNFQINAQPDMVPLLISLIKYSRWEKVHYLYNNPEGNFLKDTLIQYQFIF